MIDWLGKKARDKVSGFDGTVLATSLHLYSVPRVLIVPHGLKDGLPLDGVWFDSGRIELVTDGGGKGFVMKERES